MLFVTCELWQITGGENNTHVDCSVNQWRQNNDVIFKKIPTRVQNKIPYKTNISDFF